MVSREAAFLYNNLAARAASRSRCCGERSSRSSPSGCAGTKITVGPPFFNTVNVPLGLLLLALTGVGPLIAWRRASRVEPQAPVRCRPAIFGLLVGAALLIALGMRNVYALVCLRAVRVRHRDDRAGVLQGHARAPVDPWRSRRPAAFVHLVARNRRRYGGYIVHAGIVMLFAAFAGMRSRSSTTSHLRAGESCEIEGSATVTSGGSSARACRRPSAPNRERHRGRRSRRSATESATASSRARSASTSTRRAIRCSSRSPKSASVRRRSRTSTSCSPACRNDGHRGAAHHVQSARRVGVDRRLRDDDRRTRRHVAAGRASATHRPDTSP